jgi:DAK2 domain fusion protein YloV
MPSDPAQPPTDPPAIDGPALGRALAAAERALEAHREALNAINVFPVPDGDTGTNMYMTMREACVAVGDIRSADMPAFGVAGVAARAALMGARGNSGVILSQILTGFAEAEDSRSPLDGRALAAALARGRGAAYRVISNPREGTILTAISAAAQAAAGTQAAASPVEALAAAAAAAQEATDRTPELLPLLREAGVVDAGAQGLAIMLDAMARSLRGDEAAAPRLFGAIDEAWLAATRAVHDAGEHSGFCTEFVITGPGLDPEAVRARLLSMGSDVLVVPAGGALRAHLHTAAPEEAFAYGRTLGAVSHEKAEDMEAQFGALEAQARPQAAAVRGVAVVAVAAGAGMEALFRLLGAAGVAHGGRTMNPSAGEIREAIAAAGGAETIVLPNNRNVVLAAEQAARDVGAGVHVVPSRSIPQGVAAMIAYNAEATAGENVAAMEAAIAAVRTGEVTLAARATKIHSIDVRRGQPIALVDGDLALAAESVAEAAYACAGRMLEGGEGAMVTLYRGEGETAEGAEALAARLRADFGCEVEVVDGGQPHYPYLIGVEWG